MNVFATAAHDTGAILEREDVTKEGHTPLRIELLLRMFLTILEIIESDVGLWEGGRERGMEKGGGVERERES